MIRSLDRGVGRVLQSLRDQGLEENTLVVFSSDNGGAGYVGIPDLNHPYRGWKMTFFEGGLHSPFFLKWPKRLAADLRVDTPAMHIDLFTTAIAAAGAAMPGDRKIDGIDLLPLAERALSTRESSTRDAIFWRSGGLSVALVDGWKLQVDGRRAKRWLFNLNEDPTETSNLIDRRKEKAKQLQLRLDEYNQEIGPRDFPFLVEAAIPIDRTTLDPYRPGEEFAYWPN